MRRNLFKSAVLAAVCACMSVSAFAALGSYPLSGSNHHVSAAAMAQANAAPAEAPAAANAAFRVNVVTLDSGTVVREFVASANNQVFAVAWSGPRLPNFVDILGTYSDRYLKPSGSDVIGGLSQRGLSLSDLVVQSFGRFGHFSGYAYLPSAVPAGVSLSELK